MEIVTKIFNKVKKYSRKNRAAFWYKYAYTAYIYNNLTDDAFEDVFGDAYSRKNYKDYTTLFVFRASEFHDVEFHKVLNDGWVELSYRRQDSEFLKNITYYDYKEGLRLFSYEVLKGMKVTGLNDFDGIKAYENRQMDRIIKTAKKRMAGYIDVEIRSITGIEGNTNINCSFEYYEDQIRHYRQFKRSSAYTYYNPNSILDYITSVHNNPVENFRISAHIVYNFNYFRTLNSNINTKYKEIKLNTIFIPDFTKIIISYL